MRLDIAARRYGVLPSQLLASNPTEFSIDIAVALRAHNRDFSLRTGEFWYLTILSMLGAKIPDGDGNSSSGDVEWVAL